MGFFSLEKRKLRAGCTITDALGVERRLLKGAQKKAKRQQSEAEFLRGSKEQFLHQEGGKAQEKVAQKGCWRYLKLDWIQP